MKKLITTLVFTISLSAFADVNIISNSESSLAFSGSSVETGGPYLKALPGKMIRAIRYGKNQVENEVTDFCIENNMELASLEMDELKEKRNSYPAVKYTNGQMRSAYRGELTVFTAIDVEIKFSGNCVKAD